MDSIRLWAAAVCAAAVAASVAQLAAPEGNVQKSFRCVIGIFFVCCVLSPFAKGITALPANGFVSEEKTAQVSAQQLADEVQKQTLSAFSQNVEAILIEALDEAEIFPEKIVVNVHVGEDSLIYINSLVVHTHSQQPAQTQKITKIVEEKTGITPQIVTGGENAS